MPNELNMAFSYSERYKVSFYLVLRHQMIKIFLYKVYADDPETMGLFEPGDICRTS